MEQSSLRLVETSLPGDLNPYEWQPFEQDDAFESRWWSDPRIVLSADTLFIGFWAGSVEVARVELDADVALGMYRPTGIERDVLEIQLIEVAETHRRMGFGRRAVEALVARFPARQLVAFSEEADEFWAGLGWHRFARISEPEFHRPLFVQPV